MSENREKTGKVIWDFIREYKNKPVDESNLAWLDRQFSAYPDLWKSPEERHRDAVDIVDAADAFQKNKSEFAAHIHAGKSCESYIASKIEAGAAASGIASIGKYVAEIDSSLDRANREMVDRVFNRDGSINLNPNLKGNIMETDQVNTFNIDAAVKESPVRAEVELSYDKNSVDIEVKNLSDGSYQRYQAKCSQDSRGAELMFERSDYVGQRKLVCKGQTPDVPNSTDHLEAEGVKSTPRTHEDYQKMQENAQKDGKLRKYDWNDTSKAGIAKAIGKKAAFAGVMAVGFQGARILGRRIWNGLTGQQNQSVEEDLQEFVSSSLQAAGGAGVAVAATGGVTVAVKSGWLGNALKATPVGHIANAVCLGIENVKILCKLGKGEISGKEALSQAGNAACSLAGGLAGGAKGASVGAAVGSILGPVGTAVGGVVGGVVGGIAGSTLGEAVYHGAKKVVSAVWSGAKKVCSAVCSGLKAIGRGIASLFSW